MARIVGNRLHTVAKVLGQLIAEDVGWPHRRGPDTDSPLERDQRRAKAVRRALESLGPFYVKIGQMLSTRPDMVSATMIAEFQNLHDEVDVQPFCEFEPVLADNLGPNWKRLFDDIDTLRPLGAASLAQVYRVTFGGGREGVIKLQRPGIRETVLADMALLRQAARLVTRAAPRFSTVVDIESMLGNIFDAMEPELDFTKEAANMEQARTSVRHFSRLAVPEVIAATPGVLVQSMAPGVSIGRINPACLSEQERQGIAKDLMAFMYRGYFIDRFYHADPHPGNIFVAPGGPATLIDWGMVGRVDQRTSMRLLFALMAVGQNDGHGLAKAWTEMGRTTPWSDIPGFCADMAQLVPKVAFATLQDVNFGVTLSAVLEKATRRGIASSPAISLLGKSFANLEGCVRCIAPELTLSDVFQKEVKRIILNLVREAVSPQETARRSLEGLMAATAIGEQLRAFADDVTNRQVSVQVSQVRRSRALGGERPSSPNRGLLALGALALYASHRRASKRP